MGEGWVVVRNGRLGVMGVMGGGKTNEGPLLYCKAKEMPS